MTVLSLSVAEPFTSPAWGSNFSVFSSGTGDVVPEAESKTYIARACKYAKHHEVYVVPERFLLMGYHCLCLISPSGDVLGSSRAAFLNLDKRTGKRSAGMEVISTEFGGIYLCVDVDIYHPEVVCVAANSGAQIIICSQYIRRGDYDTGMVVSGVWNASQNNAVYTVGVSNEFNCVCAPRSLTQNADGFLVPPNLKLPMTAKLDADKLSGVPMRYPLSRKFYSLHRMDLLE